MRWVLAKRNRAVAVAAVGVVLAGCSKAEIAKLNDDRDRPWLERIAEVAPSISTGHLDECRKRVEVVDTAFAGRWTLAGPLRPHVQATCLVNSVLFDLLEAGKKKRVVYLAPAISERNILGSRPTTGVKGCTFLWENGKVTAIAPHAPEKVSSNSSCYFVRG